MAKFDENQRYSPEDMHSLLDNALHENRLNHVTDKMLYHPDFQQEHAIKAFDHAVDRGSPNSVVDILRSHKLPLDTHREAIQNPEKFESRDPKFIKLNALTHPEIDPNEAFTHLMDSNEKGRVRHAAKIRGDLSPDQLFELANKHDFDSEQLADMFTASGEKQRSAEDISRFIDKHLDSAKALGVWTHRFLSDQKNLQSGDIEKILNLPNHMIDSYDADLYFGHHNIDPLLATQHALDQRSPNHKNALRYSKLPDSTIRNLINNYDESTLQDLSTNPHLSSENITDLYNNGIKKAALHPAASPGILDRYYKEEIVDRSFHDRHSFMSSHGSGLPIETQKDIAGNAETSSVMGLLQNKDLDTGVVTAALNHPDQRVRIRAAIHPAVSHEAVPLALKNGDIDSKDFLSKSRNYPPEVLNSKNLGIAVDKTLSFISQIPTSIEKGSQAAFYSERFDALHAVIRDHSDVLTKDQRQKIYDTAMQFTGSADNNFGGKILSLGLRQKDPIIDSFVEKDGLYFANLMGVDNLDEATNISPRATEVLAGVLETDKNRPIRAISLRMSTGASIDTFMQGLTDLYRDYNYDDAFQGAGIDSIFSSTEERLEGYTDSEKTQFWDKIVEKTSAAIESNKDQSSFRFAPPLVSTLYSDSATNEHKKQAIGLLEQHIMTDDVNFNLIDPYSGSNTAKLITDNEQFVADFVVNHLWDNQFKKYVGNNISNLGASPKIYEALTKKLLSENDWNVDVIATSFSGGNTIRNKAFRDFTERLLSLSSDPMAGYGKIGSMLGNCYNKMLEYGAIASDEIAENLKKINPEDNVNYDNVLVSLFDGDKFAQDVDGDTVKELLSKMPPMYQESVIDLYLKNAPASEAVKLADLTNPDHVKDLIKKPRDLSVDQFRSLLSQLDYSAVHNLYEQILAEGDAPDLLFGQSVRSAFNDTERESEMDREFLDKLAFHTSNILENSPDPTHTLSLLIKNSHTSTSRILAGNINRDDIVAKAVYDQIDQPDIKDKLGVNILSNLNISDDLKASLAQDLINKGRIDYLLSSMLPGVYTPLGSQRFTPGKQIKKQLLSTIKSPDFLSKVNPKSRRDLAKNVFSSGIISSVSSLSAFYRNSINQLSGDLLIANTTEFLSNNSHLLDSATGANFLKKMWKDASSLNLAEKDPVHNSKIASMVMSNDKLSITTKSAAFWSSFTDLPSNTNTPKEVLTDKRSYSQAGLHVDSHFFNIISNPMNARKLNIDDIQGILEHTAPSANENSLLVDNTSRFLANGSLSYKNVDTLLESMRPIVASGDPAAFLRAQETILNRFDYDDGVDSKNIYGLRIARRLLLDPLKGDVSIPHSVGVLLKALRSVDVDSISKHARNDLPSVDEQYIDFIHLAKEIGHPSFNPMIINPLIDYNSNHGNINKLNAKNSSKVVDMLTDDGFFGDVHPDYIESKINHKFFTAITLNKDSLKKIADRYPASWCLGLITADGFKEGWLDEIPDEVFKYSPAQISTELVKYSSKQQSKSATAKVLEVLAEKVPSEVVSDSGHLEHDMREFVEKSGHLLDKKAIDRFLDSDAGKKAKDSFLVGIMNYSTNKDPEVHKMAIDELGIRRVAGKAIMDDDSFREAVKFVVPQDDDEEGEGEYDLYFLKTLLENKNLTETQSDSLADVLTDVVDSQSDLDQIWKTIVDNPSSSLDALDLADDYYYKYQYPSYATFEVEDDFNPILSHPVHGNSFFHELIFPDECNVNSNTIKTLHSVEHSKAQTILREVSKMIPPQGISWVDFKKMADKRYEQTPVVKQLFMKARKQYVMPEDVMEAIGNDPGQYTLTYATWGRNLQTHMQGGNDNLVVQLNASPELHKEISKDPKVAAFYHSIVKVASNSSHPVTPQIINWVRIDNSNPDAWVIEEIQSDFDKTLRTQIDKIAKEKPEGTNISGHFFTIPEMHHAAKEIGNAISGWFEASHKAVEELARQNGVKELYMHGPNVRGAMSFDGNTRENPYPEWLNYMYSVAPSKDPDWEKCDYTDYPEWNQAILDKIKGNHEDYRSTHCWRKKLT